MKKNIRDSLLICFVGMPLALFVFLYSFSPTTAGRVQWTFSAFISLWTPLFTGVQLSQLLRGTLLSLGLILSSFVFALPLSSAVGAWCAHKKGRSWLRLAISVLSAIPVFVTVTWAPKNQFCWMMLPLVAINFWLGRRIRHRYTMPIGIVFSLIYILVAIFAPRFSWGVVVLVFGNLTLSALTRDVYVGMLRELRESYVVMAQLKGVPAYHHYWRRLVVLLLTPLKSQIPYYLSAAIVVEGKLDLVGLGYLVLEADETSNFSQIAGICIFTVIIVQVINLLVEWQVKNLLPGREGKLEDEKIESRSQIKDFTGWLKSFRISVDFRRKLSLTSNSPDNPKVGSFFQRGLIYLRQHHVWLGLKSYLRGSLSRPLVLCFTGIILMLAIILFGLALGPLPYRDIGHKLITEQRETLLPSHFSGRENENWDVDRFQISWRNTAEEIQSMSPAKGWLLGPDRKGRSVWSRILEGARPYLLPAIKALLISILGGTLLAAIAGYWQHSVIHQPIQMVMDFIDSLPKLVVLLAVYMQMDLSAYHESLMPFVGMLFIPDIYYSVKDQVLHFRQHVFVEAESALGAGVFRILFRHILWKNSLSTILIRSAYIMGNIILVDAMLAYIRLDQQDFPSWGSMIVDYYRDLKRADVDLWTYWAPVEAGMNIWAYWAPVVAVVLSITAYNLLGDGLRVLSASKSTEGR